jgi:hypothetical protein
MIAAAPKEAYCRAELNLELNVPLDLPTHLLSPNTLIVSADNPDVGSSEHVPWEDISKNSKASCTL